MNSLMVQGYAVFTVCNLAYLSKALVLAESLLIHGNEKIKIYIIDRKCNISLPSSVAEFIWIEDVGVPNLLELAFKYDITEFSTSVKPFITLKLIEKFPKVIFLDPDTCVYHSLDVILNELDSHPIVLTPHYLSPHSYDLPDADTAMLRFGSFNLGFFAVSISDETLSFLKWWCDKCFKLCYFESQFGLSTDQKWVSIAPCFFHNIHVSTNVGYNMAFWNVHERVLSKSNDGLYFVNIKYPLIFFHFSSFDEKNTKLLSKRWFPERNSERIDWFDISDCYNSSLKRHELVIDKIKYGFDYMSNGDYISPTLRRAYACVLKELPIGHDPFDSRGSVGRFITANNLVQNNNNSYVSSGYVNIDESKWKFHLVNILMRLILRMLGPNNFANFSRLLVYLSSYRQNRELWKL